MKKTVYQQAQLVIDCMNCSDFDAIYSISNPKMQEVLSAQELKEN